MANRVNEIQEAIPSSQWRHVSTEHNPADYASRGLSPADLIKAKLWWKGPPWLSLTPEHWPHQPNIEVRESLPEIRPIVNNIQLKTSDLWERFSSFDNLLRVIAWCRRFTRNCQIKDREKSPRLTNEELNSARTSILAAIQRDSYASTLEVFQRGKLLLLSNSLFSLNPLLDNDGLLRVGGRLQNSERSETSTHPIILDRRSPVVRLFSDSYIKR